MIWEPQNGEVVYPENLGEIWFGNFLPGWWEGPEEQEYIRDFDDCLDGGTQDQLNAKNTFHFVTDHVWGTVVVDYVQPIDTTTQAGVRADCDGLDYVSDTHVITDYGEIGQEENVYTCLTSDGPKWSVAGDYLGGVHVQNHLTGTETVHDQGVDWNPVVRITKDRKADDTGTTRFYAFRKDATIVFVDLNVDTGVVSTTVYDLKSGTDTDGVLIPSLQRIRDVCVDSDGQRWMIKTRNNLYFLYYKINVGQTFFNTLVANNWDTYGDDQMIAMEFVNDDYVLVINSTSSLMGWYKTPAPLTGGAGVWTVKSVKVDGSNEWLHMIPYDDGSKALLLGKFTNYEPVTNPQFSEHLIGIYVADMSPDSDVTPKLLFTWDGWTERSGWWTNWKDYVAAIAGPGRYQGQTYRGRRRWGQNQFWFVTSGRDYMLTVGVRNTAQSFTAGGNTSTTNKLTWTPPIELERDQIAYTLIERSECDGDYGCVFATDDLGICEYIDDENPTIQPVEAQGSGGNPDVWQEVGLVTQADIDDFDPSLDTWPDGRTFWYKLHRVSYLNIETSSDEGSATTKPPIKPVQINDEKGLDLEYTNIPITARSFGLEWDWTSHGETPAEDFKMWQVAFFEDQNPSVRNDVGWTLFKFYPQPLREPPIVGSIWSWRLPWMYSLQNGERDNCFVDGVSFKSIKSRTVDKKYLRWENNNIPTEEEDKRYSPLLPDTMYVVSVIGWDKGGLWRAAAKETHVPIYSLNANEMTIDRQIVYIRTLAETTFAAICEFDKQSSGEIFREWTDDLNPPLDADMQVSGTPAAARAIGQRFNVDYEIELTRLQFYVKSTAGSFGDLRVSIYNFDSGVLGSDPGTEITGSELIINSADVKIGWNTVEYATPLTLRNGRYLLRIGPNTNFPVASSVTVKGLYWPNDTGKGSWLENTGVWSSRQTVSMNCRIWFDEGQLSEGFVMEGGRQLTFDFRRSTVTDSEETIFEDQCYKDTDLYDIIMGAAADYQYAGGWLETTYTGNDLILMAKANNNYGIETRSLLCKLTLQYSGGPLPANLPFALLLHETAPEDITIDGSGHPDDGRGYYVVFDLITGQIFLRQAKRFQGPSETWFDTAASPTYPGAKPPSGNQPWEVWIKIVDDTISVFTELNGYSVEENFAIGNSILKATVWEGNDFWYNFSRYGYIGLFLSGQANVKTQITDFEVYGAVDISEYEGGQGTFIDYGDGSTSGYRASEEITKIYTVEPDDALERYFAEISGRNRNNADDLGFVMPWLDYPAPISINDYSKQTFDFDIKNAPPIVELNVPGVGYTGVTVTMDGVGSSDPEGGDVIFHWDLGDGTTTQTTTPFITHIYNSVGNYLVTLYLEDELGQTSEVLTSEIQIGEQYADFVDIIFNHPIQSEDVNRVGGVSSDNTPDRCGGELQDGGGGNRRFNINGIHAPPRCCCDEITNYQLVLNLERICSEIELWEEGTTIIPGEEGYDYRTCDYEIYRTIAPALSTRVVGDLTGGSQMYQQDAQYTFQQSYEVCACEFWVSSKNLSGFPWDVEVAVQNDAGGNPDGIDLVTAQIPAANLTAGAWNRWDFPYSVPVIGLMHFVIRPTPCPIGSGQADFIELGTIGLAPNASQESVTTPTCTPPIWVFNFEEEILQAYWDEEGIIIPPTPSTETSWTKYLGLLRSGCCDEEFIPYNGGIAQSFDVTKFDHEYTTKLKIEVPMCVTEDFDGDIQGELLEDLISGKTLRKSTPQFVRNVDLPVCAESTTYILYNEDTESNFIQEDDAYTQFTPNDVRLLDNLPGCCDFGDGSDGDVVIAVNTSLAADMQYENLTINAGVTLDVAGYIVRVRNRFTNLGGYVTDSTTGGTGGAGGAGGVSNKVAEANGGAGSNGVNGTGGSIGGCSGNGAVGGGGGGSGATQDWNLPAGMLAPGGDGGVGGQGGDGGGCVRMYVWELDNQGSINADGYDGQDGVAGLAGSYDSDPPIVPTRDIAGGGGGGGGGGSGGNPGRVYLYYHSIINNGSITSNGGMPGQGGAGGTATACVYASPGGSEKTGGAGGGGWAGWGIGGAGGDGEEDIGGPKDGNPGVQGIEPEYNIPYTEFLPGVYPTTKGYYVMTNHNQINTSTWKAISSMQFTQNEPANTQLRYLVSFDGRVTWYRWTGAAWAVTPLANISTLGNTKEQLEALGADEWGILFTAGTFDIVVELKTTDQDTTPWLSRIDIDYELSGSDIAVAVFEFDVCQRIMEELGTIYFTLFGSGGTAGGFNVITTVPYADRYHYGSKWRYINNAWVVSPYEDICLKIFALSDCTELGWCEYEFVDWLRCNRYLVKLDLPGLGIIGGKLVDHSIGKSYNEPFTWIPFNIIFEEIDLEQFSR